MEAINPDVCVVPHDLRLTSENILEIIDGYDIVVDGSDNFPTRYLVNDACVMTGMGSCASRGRSRRSPQERGPATDACIQSHLPRAWCRAAGRRVCWGPWRASWEPSRLPKC
jgi:hypothetical protein